MNDLPSPRRASEWLVALNEQPDDAGLRARFDAWLAESADHVRDWSEILQTWNAMGMALPAHARDWAQDSNIVRPVFGRRRLGLVSATLAAAAAALAIVFVPDLVIRMQADHATATAELRTVELADGSHIRLAPDSAIDVAMEASERRITLLKGQAFFEVTPDAQRPFHVTAGSVRTTVLGTAFEVRLGADATEVSVREGSVRVARSKAPPVSERLGAGDWVRVAAAGEIAQGTRATDLIAAWTQGQLVAKDRAVGDVVDELRRYYSGIVVLRGDNLARQPLTGVYNLNDPVSALRAVARAQGASVHQISPWILVISAS